MKRLIMGIIALTIAVGVHAQKDKKATRILDAVIAKTEAQKTISDIAIGDKKILGSSMYRKKNTIFYHAVLNVSESITEISKHLKSFIMIKLLRWKKN